MTKSGELSWRNQDSFVEGERVLTANLAEGMWIEAHVREDGSFTATTWDAYGEERQFWSGEAGAIELDRRVGVLGRQVEAAQP